MKATIALIVLLFASLAMAAPAEDHWGADADTPDAQAQARAKTMIDAGDFTGALPILQDLANRQPGNPDVFNLLGFAYRKTGDLVRSAPAYERALFLKPDHLGALEYQGELFLTLNDPKRAEVNLARMNKICPTCEETEELAEAIRVWRAAQ